MSDNVTPIGKLRRPRGGNPREREVAARERRMARAFVDYQRAIVEGQPVDEMDELLEELERAVGDYHAFMRVSTFR